VKQTLTALAVLGLLLGALGSNDSKPDDTTFQFPDVEPDPEPLRLLGPAGEQFTFLKTGATTDGSFVLAIADTPPGAGPLPHVHRNTDEWFYIAEGTVQMQMGSRAYPAGEVPGKNAPRAVLHTMNANRGTLLYGPRNVIHGYKNIGDKPAKIITVWAPDKGVTDYFKAVAQPLPDPDNPPPINPKNQALFVSEAPRFGIDQSAAFDQYIEKVDGKFPHIDSNKEALVKLLSKNTKAPAVTPLPSEQGTGTVYIWVAAALGLVLLLACLILLRKKLFPGNAP
jgi:mannose-6-phosphate isomerase-like protein (cupin superfamily)